MQTVGIGTIRFGVKKEPWYYKLLAKEHPDRLPYLKGNTPVPETINEFIHTDFLNDRNHHVPGEVILEHFINNQDRYDGKEGPEGYKYGKSDQYIGRWKIPDKYVSMYGYALDKWFGFKNEKTFNGIYKLLFQLGILNVKEEVKDLGFIVDSKTRLFLSPKAHEAQRFHIKLTGGDTVKKLEKSLKDSEQKD